MRIILLLLISFNFCFSQSINLNLLRNSFVKADQNEKQCNELLNQSAQMMSANDIAKAYNAAAKMMSSKFKINPIEKWNNFKLAKKELDELIEKNYTNLEIRFLRYCMQKKSPSFLNYRDNIEEDKIFIHNASDSLNTELLNFINPILITLNNE